MTRDLTITAIDTITAFDIATGAFKFMLDELQSASIAQSQEVTDITGKQGRKLNSLKRNKQVTITGTNGYVSGGLTELQTGGEFDNKTTEVAWHESVAVASDEATTSYKAVGTAGAEITALYVRSSDGSMGEELEQAAAAAEGKFAYTPSTKKLTFNTGDLADGTEVIVFYNRNITADVHVNPSDKYSGKCKMYIDCTAEDKCANIYRVQFQFDKADFNGDFTWEMGGDQTVHEFEASSLAGACGGNGNLWTFIVFGENAADAT